MESYIVKVANGSRDFTARERLKLKDTTRCVKLDDVVEPGHDPLVITPVDWAELEVHNEKSSNPEYRKYVIVAEDGVCYTTGSVNFWSRFMDIYSEMFNEAYELEIYKCESKNYKGKYFLTCSVH